ncbi:MAG: energy-coupling factor transporter transmembrane component T family protein [Candidatus Hermodarchaeota archaeon]
MKTRTSSFGYLQRDSFIHRLNPLTKFLVLILVAILTVTLVSVLTAITLFCFILLGFVIAKISLRYAFGRLRRLLAFIIIIAIVQILFTSYGFILFYLIPALAPGFGPFLPITTIGIINALNLAFRLINIVLVSALFVATTDPSRFAASLTQLHIPYRYGYTLVLALRLVPLFDDESNTVQAAQRARGIPIDRGIIRSFMRRIRYTFIPLIFSALGRVDALTLAMDGRGFGFAKTRTFLSYPRFTVKDWGISITSILITVFCLWFFLFVMPLPQLI